MRYLILDQSKIDDLWRMWNKRKSGMLVSKVASELTVLDKITQRFRTGTYGTLIPIDDLEFRQIEDLLTSAAITYKRPIAQETD